MVENLKLEPTFDVDYAMAVWREHFVEDSGPPKRIRPSDQERIARAGRHADYAGDCWHPVTLTLPEAYLLARCRKCGACLAQRRRMWFARCMRELERSDRTWFITLTFRPFARQWLQSEAVDSTSLARTAYRESQSFISALRKRYLRNARQIRIAHRKGQKIRPEWLPRTDFRYFFCVEPHPTSGFPHLHGLIFQAGQISRRRLQAAWRHGFSHAVLVTKPEAIAYAGKAIGYVTKSEGVSRIRCSKRFGAET